VAERSPYVQTISWLYDLRTRGLLNLDPPYQRRAVWSDKYREDFVDTILLDYPAPPIFLFETITEDGIAQYDVVDGKQRLNAVFHFISNEFAVGPRCPIESLRGSYFESFDKERRIRFFKYKFSIEILSVKEESILDSIFDRLNRNVAKLTAQELRHAKYDGEFITSAETMAVWLSDALGDQFPKLSKTARKQMKDVESVATLLLYLEEGPKSYSTAEMDQAFADRDDGWDQRSKIEDDFRQVAGDVASIICHPDGAFLNSSRFRNQADFYSLFGAISSLRRESRLPAAEEMARRLCAFNLILEAPADDITASVPIGAAQYFAAARAASNDAGPRKLRIAVLKDVILGNSIAKSYDDAARG